jgi:hypothetical protein
MKAITIGLNARGEPINITPEMRQSTHMHIIGGSGKGKSKLLDWMIRKDIREGNGLCLIDWHGTLYQDLLRYCAHLDVGLNHDFREIILLNPSKSDFVTGFNPFMNQGADVSTQVGRRIDATIKPWGITDTNQLPTFEAVCRILYTFAVEQRETLHNARHLIDSKNTKLREYAANVIRDDAARERLEEFLEMSAKDLRQTMLSTQNRLGRFLGSSAVRRFMNLPLANVNLMEIMDGKKILLVNLGDSDYLDREAARVFASLLLNEFYETARRRAQIANEEGRKPEHFSLYLDEFQEYITGDIGPMLDQVRKGGLHMVLAHQHLGHLADDPKLRKSIFTNARIRAVLGGLDYEDACVLANEMFLPDLNTRQIKKAYYHTTHLYDEQRRTVVSRSDSNGTSKSSNWSEGQSSGFSSGSGYGSSSGSANSANVGYGVTMPGAPGLGMQEGWFTETDSYNNSLATSASQSVSNFDSESYSEFSSTGGSTGSSQSRTYGESVVPVWVPIPVQELGSESEWSREEKVSKVAEMLKFQMRQHCFIKLDEELTQPMKIPFVKTYPLSQESLLEYEQAIYNRQGAIPAEEVDRLLEENKSRFLSAAGVIDITPASEPQLETITSERSKKSPRKNLFNDINPDDPIGRE